MNNNVNFAEKIRKQRESSNNEPHDVSNGYKKPNYGYKTSDSGNRVVETTSRLARWRIDNLVPSNICHSGAFKIGKWNWHLHVEKQHIHLFIKLYPDTSNLTIDNLPIASFIIRVVSSVGGCKSSKSTDIQFTSPFVWKFEYPLTGEFIIDIEFLDLKTASREGGEICSIWAEELTQKPRNATALASLGRMLTEGIHTDIIINASDGSIGAHRAILAARSPVFRSMFSHDLKEKELSTINIRDMSIDTCQAFLNFIYGNIGHEEFLTHRLALLRAADKYYDIPDLKEACHESLLEDIDTKNVLERLQNASIYQSPRLKTSCIQYLVKFGKISDIRDDFNAFLQYADRDLIAEIVNEVLNAWNGC